MPPKVNITYTVEGALVDDLDALADERNSNRSTEITRGAMAVVNDAIEDGELDPEEHDEWDIPEIDRSVLP